MRGGSVERRARRWTWTIAALLAALLVCGVTDGYADNPEPFTVTVRLHVDRSIAPRVLSDVLKAEAASLWRPYGVEIEWAGAGDGERGGFPLDAVVEHSLLSKWTAVLGKASIALDTPQKPIFVSFDATERVLATHTAGSTFLVVRDRDLARALGRVLAHEIGHVLLAAPYHDAAGLMRANFLSTDLVAADRASFRLTPNDIARLRSRVRVLSGAGL